MNRWMSLIVIFSFAGCSAPSQPSETAMPPENVHVHAIPFAWNGSFAAFVCYPSPTLSGCEGPVLFNNVNIGMALHVSNGTPLALNATLDWNMTTLGIRAMNLTFAVIGREEPCGSMCTRTYIYQHQDVGGTSPLQLQIDAIAWNETARYLHLGVFWQPLIDAGVWVEAHLRQDFQIHGSLTIESNGTLPELRLEPAGRFF
jgi:hypothetical protein